MNKIKVSVLCISYNHEKYIRQALDGIIKQEVDFQYEIIVHDDASTDNTSSIILEYAKRYPRLIKPVIRKENRFKQHLPLVSSDIIEMITGDYVAVCECDDYWTDSKKLQKQVLFMENNRDCAFCVHKVGIVTEDSKTTELYLPSFEIQTGILSSRDFLSKCGEYSFQTSSYFFRRTPWVDFYKNPPLFRLCSPVGDIPQLLYFGSIGPVFYIDEVMSCYRRGVPNSSTVKQAQSDYSNKIVFARGMKRVFQVFDEYTNECYHEICMDKIRGYSATEKILDRNARQLIRNKILFNGFDNKRKVFLLFASLFPSVAKKIYILRLRLLSKKNKVL